MRGGMRKLRSNRSQVGQRSFGGWQLHSINTVRCQHVGRYNRNVSGRISLELIKPSFWGQGGRGMETDPNSPTALYITFSGVLFSMEMREEAPWLWKGHLCSLRGHISTANRGRKENDRQSVKDKRLILSMVINDTLHQWLWWRTLHSKILSAITPSHRKQLGFGRIEQFR